MLTSGVMSLSAVELLRGARWVTLETVKAIIRVCAFKPYVQHTSLN